MKRKLSLILRSILLVLSLSLSVGKLSYGQALSVSGTWKKIGALSGDNCAETLKIELEGRNVTVTDVSGEVWKFNESDNWSTEEGSRYLVWRKFPLVFEVFEERRVSKPEFETTKIRFDRSDSTLLINFSREYMMKRINEVCHYTQF